MKTLSFFSVARFSAIRAPPKPQPGNAALRSLSVAKRTLTKPRLQKADYLGCRRRSRGADRKKEWGPISGARRRSSRATCRKLHSWSKILWPTLRFYNTAQPIDIAGRITTVLARKTPFRGHFRAISAQLARVVVPLAKPLIRAHGVRAYAYLARSPRCPVAPLPISRP